MTDADLTPVTVTPVAGRVHVFFDDAEIGSSTRARRCAGDAGERFFLPLEDVHPGILEASETTRDEAGLGTAHYYTIKTLTADGVDEAWYFPYAAGVYEPIRDLMTFGGDRVRVEVTQV